MSRLVVHELPAALKTGIERFAELSPCGSRVTCDPPPVDTDEDWLVVAEDAGALSALIDLLAGQGFEWEGASEHYQNITDDGFMSWRKDRVNFIVTKNQRFAERHRAATHVCKLLNIGEKQKRIALFQAVLYGNKYEPKAA